MEYKYLFGSKMLKLENNRDEDWLVFTDQKIDIENKSGSISFQKRILDHFIAGKNIKADPYKAGYLYQLSRGFDRDENYIFYDFNILDHKTVWIKWLKAFINSKQTEASALKTTILPKYFYHILYQYYMIKEDTHWISAEAKAEVQKIHDLEMPSSYFEELRALINSL